MFTLEDVVEYKHLVPGKEYTVKGMLMDKTTGEPLLIDEKEIRSEITFTPDEPTGEVIVSFEFDTRYIKKDTDIVVFESLYSEDKELAVHAEIDDEGQTVTVKIPKIGTKASVDGKRNSQLTAILLLTMLFPTRISQQEKNTQSKASLWINPRVSNSLLTAKKFVPK